MNTTATRRNRLKTYQKTFGRGPRMVIAAFGSYMFSKERRWSDEVQVTGDAPMYEDVVPY